ncbi:DUF4293 domain-containing protein [Phocaeicola faecicola]|jgi:hypothetical protein|uniref:DUF4293 domain-containing protein n=1 Tax=Phocaeicola faecicola TaxID=2739389 RepID=UPI0015B4C0B7|nr:DUF4293 domain-containing protein [Phocaeicola faecicola]MCI5744602.1 DUF4293 domain-containing protein [Bacteroides sp.]MDD6908030.1 DUF4293 domain-containing protein [Bacteroidaceae bacterium]MDY4871270.1 DUF4293 domain-containing protein [Phocaeicola faecicola]
MIQRIQTVYLLIVAILMVLMMSFPIGFFYTEAAVAEMSNLSVALPDGALDYTPWALFVLLMLVAVLSLATIFLYKKRMLQIRLTLFSSIVLIGYYATLAFFVYSTLKGYGSFTYSWTVSLPVVSIILNWLAIRAIGKDEMLVKAYERLR